MVCVCAAWPVDGDSARQYRNGRSGRGAPAAGKLPGCTARTQAGLAALAGRNRRQRGGSDVGRHAPAAFWRQAGRDRALVALAAQRAAQWICRRRGRVRGGVGCGRSHGPECRPCTPHVRAGCGVKVVGSLMGHWCLLYLHGQLSKPWPVPQSTGVECGSWRGHGRGEPQPAAFIPHGAAPGSWR